MAGLQWLLLAVVLCAVMPGDSAASTKVVVAHIQCAVCKVAVKELALRAKAKGAELTEDEDALVDAIDNLCTATKDEGKWITKIDVVQKQAGAQLSLDRRDADGVCQNECNSVQRACSTALKGKDESLVSLIRDSAGVGRLQREVCKKACAKAVPELSQDYADEAWKPAMAPAPPAPSMKDLTKPTNDDVVIPPRSIEIVPDILASAFEEFGSRSDFGHTAECFNQVEAFKTSGEEFLEQIAEGAKEMLKKTAVAMSYGLTTVARGVSILIATYQESCTSSQHAVTIKALAETLIVYAQDVEKVEYKAMEVLKVHGHDIHKLLNSFIGAWKHEPADGKAIGKALIKLLKALEDDAVSEAGKTEL